MKRHLLIFLLLTIPLSCTSLSRKNTTTLYEKNSQLAGTRSFPIHTGIAVDDSAEYIGKNGNHIFHTCVGHAKEGYLIEVYQKQNFIMKTLLMTDLEKIRYRYEVDYSGQVRKGWIINAYDGTKTELAISGVKGKDRETAILEKDGYVLEVDKLFVHAALKVVKNRQGYVLIFYNKQLPFVYVRKLVLSSGEYRRFLALSKEEQEKYTTGLDFTMVNYFKY